MIKNHDISWQARRTGDAGSPGADAAPAAGARLPQHHWVTPEHVVPQILEAVPLAIAGGLRLPIVDSTSSYDSLRLMQGVVDVYMPDFKV